MGQSNLSDNSTLSGKLVEIDAIKTLANILVFPHGNKMTFEYNMKYEDMAQFIDENIVFTYLNGTITNLQRLV